MEDEKLEAYYNDLKRSGPKGRRGGLGASRRGGGQGEDGLADESLPDNPLYRRFVRPGWQGGSTGVGSQHLKFGAAGQQTVVKAVESDDEAADLKPKTDEEYGFIGLKAKKRGRAEDSDDDEPPAKTNKEKKGKKSKKEKKGKKEKKAKKDKKAKKAEVAAPAPIEKEEVAKPDKKEKKAKKDKKAKKAKKKSKAASGGDGAADSSDEASAGAGEPELSWVVDDGGDVLKTIRGHAKASGLAKVAAVGASGELSKAKIETADGETVKVKSAAVLELNAVFISGKVSGATITVTKKKGGETTTGILKKGCIASGKVVVKATANE